MAVISVTITESTEEVVDGIPKTISLSTNIPATIFYTLDGTTPDTTSSVYVTPITLPTLPAPQLRIFATNGTDSSAIIEQDYGPDISFARLPHAAVTGLDINSQNSLGLFGSNTQDTAEAVYQNSGQAGITVLAPDLETFPSGRYDADGNPAALTNESLQSYKIIQSESNVNGETGYGIGTLVPVNKLPERDNNVPEESNRAQKLFNPRALVVYQDASTEDTTAPPQLNREFFSLEVPEKEKDGALLYNNGPNTATTTASFLKSYYNPRDNTITYYYRDSSTNRWLVSKQPYQLRDPNVGNLSNMVFGRETGNGFIFRWIPFARRVLT